MIDFDLTEEHQLLEQSVREWAAREVAPRIRELDREHRFDPNILPQMARLGLLGCSVPVEYGGAGMDYISLGIASEELEYVDTSLRVIMSVHAGLNCLTLLAWGNDDQKQRYLVPQAQGKKIATYGLTEPAAGSDVRGIQTVAVKKGDRFLLSGEKMWISLADVADNFLVFAWTDLEKKKQRDPSGISAFVIERGFKGFSSGTLKEKWGILAGNTGFFKMEEVEVPERPRAGEEEEDDEADDDGREAHPRVHERDEEAAPREPAETEEDSGRDADEHGEEDRDARDEEREDEDAGELPPHGNERGQGRKEPAHPHFFASGTKSGWPNLARPNSPISLCTSGATSHSANRRASFSCVFGCFPGFTTMTR